MVTPTPIELAQRGAVRLRVSVYNVSGALLVNTPVMFASRDPSLVSVTAEGEVRSVGPVGNAVLLVSALDSTAEIPVTISQLSKELRATPNLVILNQLQSTQIQLALFDVIGEPVPGADFTVESSQPSIATLTPTGLLRSHGPSGFATITVRAGGVSTYVEVTVRPVPTRIEIVLSPLEILENSSRTLSVRVYDALGMPFSTGRTFAASPAPLLTAGLDGRLRAGAGPGVGTLTATTGSTATGFVSTTVPITVIASDELEGVVIDNASGGVGVPQAAILTPDGTMYGAGSLGWLHVGDYALTTVGNAFLVQGPLVSIDRNPVSGMLYVAGPGSLLEVDPVTRRIVRQWTSPPGEQLTDVAVAPTGETVFVSSASGWVRIIAASSMTALAGYSAGVSIGHLAVHPTLPLVFASGGGLVLELNVETGSQRAFAHPSAQGVEVTSDGERLIVGSESGTLAAFILQTGERTAVDIPNCPIYDVVTTPDDRLLATCPARGSAVLLDAHSLGVIATVWTGGTPRRAGISPDGTRAVIANAGGWYTYVR